MRATFLFLSVLAVTFSACSTDDVPAKPSIWGIAYSERVTTASAGGIVDRLNEGPRVTYAISTAYLLGGQKGDSLHTLTYVFTSHDSLRIGVSKVTNDRNFHYPGVPGENRLRYAVYNGQPLTLRESNVVIDPRTGENKVSTVIDIATSNAGAFVGNVSSVPLLRSL